MPNFQITLYPDGTSTIPCFGSEPSDWKAPEVAILKLDETPIRKAKRVVIRVNKNLWNCPVLETTAKINVQLREKVGIELSYRYPSNRTFGDSVTELLTCWMWRYIPVSERIEGLL